MFFCVFPGLYVLSWCYVLQHVVLCYVFFLVEQIVKIDITEGTIFILKTNFSYSGVTQAEKICLHEFFLT